MHILKHYFWPETIRREWKEEKLWVALCSPFLVCHHFCISGWLIQRSKERKYMIGFFNYSCFLEWFLSIFKACSGLKRKCHLKAFSTVLTHSYKKHASLLQSLSLAELPHSVDPPEFCVYGTSAPLHPNKIARNSSRHAYCVCLLCSSAYSIVPSHKTPVWLTNYY